MASAYSQPIQYLPYQPQFNKELLNEVLSTKQQTYDFNRERIQQTLNRVVGLDVMKEEDQDYLYSRIQAIADEVNRYGMGDLSDNSRANYLNSYISQVADDKVHNAYSGTLAVRNIYAEAEAAKEDGTYSEQNLAYSLQAAQSWLSDGQVGSEYKGNSNYTPYVDTHTYFMDVIKELEPEAYSVLGKYGTTTTDLNKDGVVDIYDSVTLLSTSGETLSATRIKNALDLAASADPNVAKQLEVNAWSQFRGVSDELLYQEYGSVIKGVYGEYEQEAQALRTEIANTTDEQKLAALQTQLDNVETFTKQIKNTSNPSRAQIEQMLYKESLLQDYANTFAYNSVTDQSLQTNDALLKQMEMESDNLALGYDVMNKIDVLRQDGKTELARNMYDRYATIVQPITGTTDFNVWEASNVEGQGSIAPIITEGTKNVTKLETFKNSAVASITSATDDIKVALQLTYDNRTLQKMGYLNQNNQWVEHKVVAELNPNLNQNRTLLNPTAIKRLRGNTMDGSLSSKVQQAKAIYKEGRQKLSYINSFDSGLKNSVANDTDNWFNATKQIDPAFRAMGKDYYWQFVVPKIKIDNPNNDWLNALDPTAFQGTDKAKAFAKAEIYYDPEADSYVIEEDTVFTRGREMAITNRLLPSWLGVEAGGSTPRYISEEEARSYIDNSFKKGYSIDFKLPEGYKNEGFKGSYVAKDYEERASEILTSYYGDMNTTFEYIVTPSNPTTMNMAAEVVKDMQVFGVELPTNISKMANPESLMNMEGAALKGAGTKATAAALKLYNNVSILVDPVTNNVILRDGDTDYEMPLAQLNPNSTAYIVLSSEVQTSNFVQSKNLEQESIFRTINVGGVVEKKEDFDVPPMSGEMFSENISGYTYDFDFKTAFSKTQSSQDMTPRVVITEVSPDGREEKFVLNLPTTDKYAEAYTTLADYYNDFFTQTDQGITPNVNALFNELTKLGWTDTEN